MSGTASVPTTFQNAVTATGLQLDNNFTTIVAYLNDPTNRNNYAADGGTTNTVVVTFSPPVVGGYTAGLQITFKAAAANSGAVVLNANGLGNVNLFSPAGQALGGGEITAGQMVSAAYDGTQFQMLSGVANLVGAATAAQQSAAVAINVFSTPGRMQNHPGVAKAWGRFNGTNTGTITAQSAYNVASIVRTSAGSYSIALTTVMRDANYAISSICEANAGAFVQLDAAKLPTTAGFGIVATNSAGTSVDRTAISFIVFGNQ